MKILVQWAKSVPEDWEEVDSDDWHKLAKKDKGSPLDDQSGLIASINVQGVIFTDFDYCHVESIADRGCRVSFWNDDDPRGITCWEFLPLAPDPQVGNQHNTRQSRVVYSDDVTTRDLYQNIEKTILRSKEEFESPPAHRIRHGHKLLDAELRKNHDEITTKRGWREWIEGVPAEKIHGGKVRG